MANTKHEDAFMKMGFDYFRDNVLKLFGIEYQFVDSAPTELVELTIHSMYMDFTFLTTEGIYVHIEFQTTDGEDGDLRRFHAYEAVLSNKTGKKVVTYVIYSGGITYAKDELDCGLYKYRTHPLYIRSHRAEEVFGRLKEKQAAGEAFTEEDFASLSLTPLMSGAMKRKDTIKTALLLAKSSMTMTAEKVMAMLYTLADKFLEGADLNEIKEVVAMTRIGQMLLDEGMEKGIEKGIEKGRKLGVEQGMKQGINAGADQMARLTSLLLEQNRTDDLKRAATDKKYRKELLEKYGIV